MNTTPAINPARIANVLADWRGKTVRLADGRKVTIGEHRHETVRLVIAEGPNVGSSVWHLDAEIWHGLENGTITEAATPAAPAITAGAAALLIDVDADDRAARRHPRSTRNAKGDASSARALRTAGLVESHSRGGLTATGAGKLWIAAYSNAMAREAVAHSRAVRTAGADVDAARAALAAAIRRLFRVTKATALRAAVRSAVYSESIMTAVQTALREQREAARPVQVTVIDATPAETIALLNDVAAEQDRAVAMLDAMLTVPGRSPESIAYVARAALRLLADDNGPLSVSGLALAELDRRHPARPVTVTRKSNGTTWHLVNRYGHQVEAGEYVTGSGRRFTIAESPATTVRPVDGEPLSVWVSWHESVPGTDSYAWQALDSLVKGWHWERAAA